jgi:hypothetical protein
MRTYATVVLFFMSRAALADGGTVQLRQESGPFVITVFTAPAPLRAGPVDASVMIQTRDGLQPVLDAEVSFKFSGLETMRASHDQAQNKVLYAAPVTLPNRGKCNYTVEIQRGNTLASVSGMLEVGESPTPLASAWRYLTLPPILIALFALREWLVRSRRSS